MSLVLQQVLLQRQLQVQRQGQVLQWLVLLLLAPVRVLGLQ